MIWFSVFVCFPHHNEVVVFSWKWSNIRTPANVKPFLSNNWTHRYPLFSSEIGRQDWPSKSSFMYFSSWTSMRISANSGTVKGNSNSVSHVGVQLSSTTFVFFMTLSAGTPAIPICNQTFPLLEFCDFFTSLSDGISDQQTNSIYFSKDLTAAQSSPSNSIYNSKDFLLAHMSPS